MIRKYIFAKIDEYHFEYHSIIIESWEDGTTLAAFKQLRKAWLNFKITLLFSLVSIKNEQLSKHK